MREFEEGSLIYLATPYSRWAPELPREEGLELAFEAAAALAGTLLLRGAKVYSPIAHTHPIAKHGKINPLDHDIWLPFDAAMMDVCDTLVVAMFDGWKDSFGVSHEIEVFRRDGKPIFYLDPEQLTIEAAEMPAANDNWDVAIMEAA
jgi:hypothetical protein